MRTSLIFFTAGVTPFMLSVSTASRAEAVGDVYGGISYGQITAQDESSRNLGTFKPATIGIGLSYVAAANLALDGYVFSGVSDSSNALSATTTMTVASKDGYGFNLRPYLALSNSWAVYAKLGRQYGTQETIMRRTTGQTTTSTTYAHTIYGVGVSYSIDPRWGISTDYTQSKRIASEQTKTSMLSVGVRYRF